MNKSLNFLLFLLATSFIIGISAAGCTTEGQVKDSKDDCMAKEDCRGFVTGTSCATECADSEFATSTTLNSKVY